MKLRPVVLALGLLLAGCSSDPPQRPAPDSPPPAAASASVSTGSTQTHATETVSIAISALSDCLTPSPGLLNFTVTITATGSRSLVPLLASDTFPGGLGANGILGAELERRDAVTGEWRGETMEKEGKLRDWLTVNLPPAVQIPSGGLAIEYRLRLFGIAGNGGTTTLHAYVVDPVNRTSLATTEQPLCVKP